MNEYQFEEFFRNKLSKYSSPIPENMWQRIQQKKDKDRKGFFIKWFLPLILIAFLIGGYFIFNANKNTDKNKSISDIKQNTVIQKDSNATLKITESKPTNLILDSTDINQKNATMLSNQQVDNNRRNSEILLFDLSHQNKKTKTIRLSKEAQNIYKDTAPDSSNDNSKTNKNIVKEYSDTEGNKQAINKISSPKDSASKDTSTLLQKHNKKDNAPPPLKSNNWAFEIYASPDIPFNDISAGNSSAADYFRRNIKLGLSFTIGAKVSVYFSKYFSIKTGFQYSQIPQTNNDSLVIPNRFRKIDIPLLIGYDICNTHFKTTINTGVIFNLYSWDIAEYRTNIYKHNDGISLYLGLNFSKPISSRFEIYSEPYFRYALSYMTNSQAPFNQKINVAGLSLGIRYNFIKKKQH